MGVALSSFTCAGVSYSPSHLGVFFVADLFSLLRAVAELLVVLDDLLLPVDVPHQ